jgi:ribosome-associated protein
LTSRTLARQIAEAASNHKAIDLVVLDLRKLSSFTNFFVICSGSSDRHVQAIADAIEDAMGKRKERLIGEEGYRLGHWVVLDYGDVVAHIFHPVEREHYRLEKLWHDVPRVRMKGITS